MIENNYLPNEESHLSEWLENFSGLLPTLGESLGITPAEISALNALITSVLKDSNGESVDREEHKLKRDKMLVFVISIVKKMKNNSFYDKENHGLKMRIE